MTARVRLLSEYEAAVLNVLRGLSWRWLGVDTITRETWVYWPTKRRVVRHHLERFTETGLAEVDDLRLWSGQRYRWNAAAPADKVAWLEDAARLEGLTLVPVAFAPSQCPQGHAHAEHGHEWPDGSRACFACDDVVRFEDGRVFENVRVDVTRRRYAR